MTGLAKQTRTTIIPALRYRDAPSNSFAKRSGSRRASSSMDRTAPSLMRSSRSAMA
jgi:hypothetical protein